MAFLIQAFHNTSGNDTDKRERRDPGHKVHIKPYVKRKKDKPDQKDQRRRPSYIKYNFPDFFHTLISTLS